MNFYELEKLAMKARIECLTSMCRAGIGYTGGCMSVMDILVALYHGELDGQPIMNVKNDYVVLSMEHSAPALEAVFSNIGETRIGGHVITSPGQGFSVGLGMALGLKMDEKPGRVYVILDDEELQNGQVWEAAMCVAHHKLNNLITIINKNGLQADGQIKFINDVESIHGKFTEFNFRVFHAPNGHSYEDLMGAFNNALYGKLHPERPACIVASTIKGKGVPFAENNVSYQSTPLSKEEIAHVIPVLQEQLELLISKTKGIL